MQAEASTEFLTGTVSGGVWKVARLFTGSVGLSDPCGREVMSQRYEWDRKAQGQGLALKHSGPCSQLAARFRDGSPKSVEAGWGFHAGRVDSILEAA